MTDPAMNLRIFPLLLFALVTRTFAGSKHGHRLHDNWFDGELEPVDSLASSSFLVSNPLGGSSHDLLSARCQSQCLYELEKRLLAKGTQPQHAFVNETHLSEVRRQLKHQIGTLCAQETKCSSCLLPCRTEMLLEEMDEDEEGLCAKHICREAVDAEECRRSCAFLRASARRKPGACPVRSDASNRECVAQCDSDAGCAEVEKCCVMGCSRLCTTPILQDRRLLPLPEGLTVQERKRRRSAVLRWVMKRMTPEHLATNSNLYVIQWRWGVKRDALGATGGGGDGGSAWQTIAVRNKLYAILKHLLVPGRYYVFRLAAVNRHGTLGFSRSSHRAFRLSKEVRAPPPPSNLSLELMEPDEVSGGWLPTIKWAPPASELPLKDYQLSWWKSTREYADAYEQSQSLATEQRYRQRRGKAAHARGEGDAAGESEDDWGDGEETAASQLRPLALNRQSTVVASYSTRASLQPSLRDNEVYMVELLATVDTAEGELRGEPAVMFIRTGPQSLVSGTKKEVLQRDIGRAGYQPVPDVQLYRVEPREREEEQEPARMEHPPAPQPVLLPAPAEQTRESLMLTHYRADVKPPYFEAGRLQSTISWLNHASCQLSQSQHHGTHTQLPPFLVYLRTLDCASGEMAPQEFPVPSCVANLKNLHFDCEYFVQVRRAAVTDPTSSPSPSSANVIVTRMTFTTPTCEQTPSVDSTLRCPLRVLSTPATDHPLIASTFSPRPLSANTSAEMNTGGSGGRLGQTAALSQSEPDGLQPNLSCAPVDSQSAKCQWPGLLSTSVPIGFRAILSTISPITDKKGGPAANVSILPAEQRSLVVEGLELETRYLFRIQAITAHGLGREFEEEIHLARMISRGSRDHNIEITSSLETSSSPPCRINDFRLRLMIVALVVLFILLRPLTL